MTAVLVAAWPALHQRTADSGTGGQAGILDKSTEASITSESNYVVPSDAGSSQISPDAGPLYESTHDLQSLSIEQTAPNQGVDGQSKTNTNLSDLEPGPGEGQSSLAATNGQLDLMAPGAGFDDVDVAEPGPGEQYDYNDQHDAGPGASNIDMSGPGPGESDSGIDEPGPGESSSTP